MKFMEYIYEYVKCECLLPYNSPAFANQKYSVSGRSKSKT